MIFIIMILVIVCGVLGYNLHNAMREVETLELNRVKFFKDLGCVEYDGYSEEEVPYGVKEYCIKPYIRVNGKEYDITKTEYFKNKVELLESKKHLKALLVSSEIQACFLHQVASFFESEERAAFGELIVDMAERLGIPDADMQMFYYKIMDLHPFYYSGSMASDYARENGIDDVSVEDGERILEDLMASGADFSKEMIKVYKDFILYLPHYRECRYNELCNVDINLLGECKKLRWEFECRYDAEEYSELHYVAFPKERNIKVIKRFRWDVFLNELAKIMGDPYPKLIERDIRDSKYVFKENVLHIYPRNRWADEFFSSGSGARVAIKLLGPGRRLFVHHIKKKGDL